MEGHLSPQQIIRDLIACPLMRCVHAGEQPFRALPDFGVRRKRKPRVGKPPRAPEAHRKTLNARKWRTRNRAKLARIARELRKDPQRKQRDNFVRKQRRKTDEAYRLKLNAMNRARYRNNRGSISHD